MRGHLMICAILLASYFSMASSSLISLKFVEDYINLSGLKDPLFILKLDDLDTFFLQMQERSFDSISCLCYEESKFDK